MESDTVEPSGRGEGETTPGRRFIPPSPLKSNMLRNSCPKKNPDTVDKSHGDNSDGSKLHLGTLID
jgi:hypothetical protein